MRQKRAKRKTGLKLLLTVVLVMCGVLTYNRGKAEQEEKEKLEEKAKLEQQLVYERERQEELKNEAAYQQTTQYKEELARKAGFVKEDEILLREEEE